MLGLLNELTSRSTSTDTREQAANTEICAVFMTTAKHVLLYVSCLASHLK